MCQCATALSLKWGVMHVSHRAYGLYGQTRTVNAYGHRKIYLMQIRSHAVSAYGLHGQLARSLRSVVLSTVSCYGHPERYT